MMLDNGDFVGFLPSISTETSYKSIPCKVSTRSEPYFVVSLSWPFQQNSPYLALFDYNLNKAKETGELKSLGPSPLCSRNFHNVKLRFNFVEI